MNLKNTEDVLDLTPKTSIMDACTVQRTIDYALDGASADAVIGATGLAKSVMLYKPSDTADNPRLRQQQDPLYNTIAAFQSALGGKTAAEHPTRRLRDGAFCTYVSFGRDGSEGVKCHIRARLRCVLPPPGRFLA